MDPDFVDTYANVGYYLRKLDINTSSRVSMLSCLLYLQQDQEVPFDEFYNYSLKQTDEKLEESSFKTLISKLHKATGIDDLIVHKDDGYLASTKLLQQIDQAEKEFDELTSHIK